MLDFLHQTYGAAQLHGTTWVAVGILTIAVIAITIDDIKGK